MSFYTFHVVLLDYPGGEFNIYKSKTDVKYFKVGRI